MYKVVIDMHLNTILTTLNKLEILQHRFVFCWRTYLKYLSFYSETVDGFSNLNEEHMFILSMELNI